MIFDRIAALPSYHERFLAAYDFIRACGPDTADGIYELTDGGVWAKVESYWTRNREEGCLEAHFKHMDVQSCLVGAEGIEIFNADRLELAHQDRDKDQMIYRSGAQPAGFIEVLPGDGLVLFPYEPHRPQMMTSRGPEHIKKVVVKIPHA